MNTTSLPERLKTFRRVDLNLFITFVAVYELRSVTAASTSLGITQPAVSHALGRLRESLEDELFYRSGNNLVPTPFSQQIIHHVYTALDAIHEGPMGGMEFQCATAKNHFFLAIPEGMELFLLPRLLQYIDEYAPHIKITTSRVHGEIEHELAVGEISLIIDRDTPLGLDIHKTKLASDQLIVVTNKNNRYKNGKLSKQEYLAAKHISVTSSKNTASIEDYELARFDLKRDISVRCAILSAALRTVENSDYLVTLGRHQLEVIQPNHNLATFNFPFPQPRMEIMMYWHPMTDKDPANRWFRSVVEHIFTQPFEALS
jgi:DNA-binding transcriptional LysR family regulator